MIVIYLVYYFNALINHVKEIGIVGLNLPLLNMDKDKNLPQHEMGIWYS